MIVADITGNKAKGFKFVGAPGWSTHMDSYIGKIGIIRASYSNTCSIIFDDGNSWSFPYPEILKHLVEEEKEEEELTIEQILNNMKKLISQI
jgi:hypothetical protein